MTAAMVETGAGPRGWKRRPPTSAAAATMRGQDVALSRSEEKRPTLLVQRSRWPAWRPGVQTAPVAELDATFGRVSAARGVRR